MLEGLTARLEGPRRRAAPRAHEGAAGRPFPGDVGQGASPRPAMPQTTANMAAIIAWELAEGGHWYNSAHYNPLNTTWRMPGATSMNSVGVKAYLSWAQGLAATVNTFHNGLYEGILAALRAGNDAQAVARPSACRPGAPPPSMSAREAGPAAGPRDA